VASYVLIHGEGGDSWYWQFVEPPLAARGHEVVAVDPPCDDDRASLPEYADCVVDAAADAGGGLIVVERDRTEACAR
jgi:pimeloyl-ACP methyl ester carboxylesterase